MRIAVIICTWNRAALLDDTLTQLGRVEVPLGVAWDILVVNNNCTDATDEVIARHARRLPIRRLCEPRPGKSFAANHAVGQTQADLLVWTDDDVLVDPHWLSAYAAAAQDWPQATFFGGSVEPLFSVRPPAWIGRSMRLLAAPYAVRSYDGSVRLLAAHEIPFGVNMAMRRQVFDREAFDTRLGPCQKTEIRGEESNLIHRLRMSGHQGVWVGTARVKHYIPPQRLTRRYLWSYYEGLGRTDARINRDCIYPLLAGAPRWAVRRFLRARLVLSLLAPFKTPRWVQALQEAGKMWGIISEWRLLHRDLCNATLSCDALPSASPALGRASRPS
jgi:glycosyltransferase involved in cell wall biosynthesis